MKKLIKMIAVIFLTFNVSGCAEYLVAEAVLATAQAISESSKNSSSYSSSSSSYVSKNYKPIMSRESNNRVCAVASNEYISSHLRTQYLEESRRRGLDCGENKSKNTYASLKNKKSKRQILDDIARETKTSFKNSSKNSISLGFDMIEDEELFYKSCEYRYIPNRAHGFFTRDTFVNKLHLNEFQKRGNSCSSYAIRLLKQKKLRSTQGWHIPQNLENFSNLSKIALCNVATRYLATDRKTGNILIWNESKNQYVKEAKRRGLNCGVDETKNTFASQENKKSKRQMLNAIAKETKNQISQNFIASKPKTVKPIISTAELQNERQKRLQLERELAEIKNKQKQKQQRINTDNQEPTINVLTKQDGSNVIISGRITDNIEIAEVLIDGQVQRLKSNGTFETPFYIPRTGKTIEIVAFDIKGNRASKILKLERGEIQSADKQQFKSLNPSLKRVKANSNALALIIGISDYENTKASALYADSDAKMFYDYANLKLGIPSSNIKELVNDSAERIDITRAIKSWLLKRTVTDKTDIYVFFAGHGLATDDGKDVYLLPYDGVPDLLEDSAIKRKELFADIQATKPRSVTVFLDTCYSGGTRNEETLVASLRPIIITAKEQALPSNFTVLSAAQGNQTSQSLEEVKHGLFSYYTMLGMEGGADSNNDNKITARELHAFIKDKVERQSQFRQTPELQGDKDRVLVQFN